ncbi:Trypsin-like protease precursor [Vibrio aerogenes CECT 7868]|uniref:Trypsin-like protease n=1 Tax=Vibrio aerogenes CECT 7868 TaxID=1216006 RepID=A0A1M5UEC7_9VIBR|nr:serine protease [Vibrio aerogenes]SHH61013.1 Trypsin-like protease precursor [Vibrio aerogenes CECT 7868]
MNKNVMALFAGLALPAGMVLSGYANATSSAKIINGVEADKDSWPYMTALIDKSKLNAFQGQFCGGTFLGGRYILTASHCVSDIVKSNTINVYASVGVHDLNNVDTEGQKAEIQNIYMHEDYYASSIEIHNDIAIIELAEEITASHVELSDDTLTNSLITGNTLTAAGWGQQSATENLFSSKLYQVDIPYTDRSTCQNVGGVYATVGDDAICAGYAEGGKDVCHGDSGGPLFYNDNGTFKQVGIVSWGTTCADENAYSVYSDVAYFSDWIAAKTSGVSYKQRINSDATTQNVQIALPVTNYGTEAFDVKSVFAIPAVSIVSHTCNDTLGEGESCQVTINVDRKAAGFLTSETDTEIPVSLRTNHTLASELKMTLHFNNAYVADVSSSDDTTSSDDSASSDDSTSASGSAQSSGSTATSGSSSSGGSGGASFGLVFLAMLGCFFRRRYL